MASPLPRRSPKRYLVWSLGLMLTAAATAAALLGPASGRSGGDALARNWKAVALVLAGDGVAGARDGHAASARFSEPFGIAARSDGTLIVADSGDSPTIRIISPQGQVLTLAGGFRGFADGAGEAARFDTPSGVAIDGAGTIYIADTGNNAIRRITRDGHVSTLAGDGAAGDRDGPGHLARFNGPLGVAVDRTGRVIVADTYNDRIRAIDPRGMVSTLAGSGAPGMADGPGAQARFHTPSGVAVDPSGNVLVADTGNALIRVVDESGLVTTAASVRTLFHPVGIAVSPAGEIYVSDGRGWIVAGTPDGAVRLLAGSTSGFRNGPGQEARFRGPAGIAWIAEGRLAVADAGNALVRLVAAPSRLELRLPAPPQIAPAFSAERFAAQPLLWPVAPFDGPHEIAGTLGEARGSEGAERFHAGIDVRIDQGTFVHAVRDGVVSSPISSDAFDSLNESLRIGPLSYVHIRAGRGRRDDLLDGVRFVPAYDGGELVGMRVKRGARFVTGERIGSVNAFNHVHLNVGWPGEEHNPLDLGLLRFEDTVPPTIPAGGVRLYDERDQPFGNRFRGRLLVSGRVRIVVDAWDQADGNRPQRRLGLYDLGYQILNRDGSPAAGFASVRHTLRFDRFAQDAEAPSRVYARGSGIPFYRGGRTRFLYIVTNTLRDGISSEGYWDTTLLGPGDYIVRAFVSDNRGNVAMANRDVPVTVLATTPQTAALHP